MKESTLEQPRQNVQTDSLLACLIAITAYYDRAASVDIITAGLPLVDGRLTPNLLVQAAERVGYAARIVKRPIRQLSNINLPAILLLKEQNSCILMSRTKGGKLHIHDTMTETIITTTLSEINPDYTGYAIFLKPLLKLTSREEEFTQRSDGHWFWGVIWRLWPAYARVFVAAAIINMLALASPLFIMNVYDRVLPNKAISTLWVLASGIGLAVVFDLALRTVRGWLVDSSGRRADVLLSSKIFEHLLSMKMSGKPKTTGGFASQLKEFENVREFFTSGTITTLTDFCFFGIFLVVIYYIGGQEIAAIPAVAAFIVLIVGVILQFPLRVAANKTQKESSYRHSLLVEAIASLETIKTIRAEGTLQRTWEILVSQTARTLEKTRKISATVGNITTGIQQLVTVAIVIVGSYLFDQGTLSMGAIIACVILAGRAVAPFGNFSMLVARSQQSLASLKALNELMGTESERPMEKNYVSQAIGDGKIEFKSVTFAYPGAPSPAVRDFNLVIRPGERVGIIGKIGSGKTTIGRLLSGIYEPTSGNILLDGIDMRQFHPHELRGAVGVVTQDSDLFYGTVRSNVLMGSRNASDEKFVRAVKLAGIDDFAMKHPAGFDMPVGERGSLLSGGQRQAITLARAFLLNPKVLFLDEPSGAMDLASERILVEHLRNALRADATIIICTHRYSMLDLVDRLVVIADGRVAADGPKEKVLVALKSRLEKP